MSKRGSRNAINFAGRNWSPGPRVRLKSNKVKKKTKKSNITKLKKQRDKLKTSRNVRRKEKFDLICQKFDFKITDLESKQLYDLLLNNFLELRAMKGSKLANKSVKNVECFKEYCKVNKVNFSIKIYFEQKFNNVDFDKKYTNAQRLKKRKSKKFRQQSEKNTRTQNMIKNLISDKVFLKLKNIKKNT